MNNIKIMLGDCASNYTDEQIGLFFDVAKAEVETYCGRSLDAELTFIAQRIATIKLLRMNTDGLASQGFSGVNEAYIDGYPQDIMFVLNRRRKVKTL